MKKTIISVALFSLLSSSVFAQTNVSSQKEPTSQNLEHKESEEDTYTRLNTEITKLDNPTSQKDFFSFYDKNHDKIIEIVKNNNNLKLNSTPKVKPELKAWNKINLTSQIYLKEGFLSESIKKGEKAEQGNKNFENLITSSTNMWLDFTKAIKENRSIKITDNDREFNNALFYNFLGLGLETNSLSKELTICKENDEKCRQEVINKNKSIVSNDIFVKLTNECSDDSDFAACRIRVINSSSFEQRLYYKNYLLGKYLFNYTQTHK